MQRCISRSCQRFVFLFLSFLLQFFFLLLDFLPVSPLGALPLPFCILPSRGVRSPPRVSRVLQWINRLLLWGPEGEDHDQDQAFSPCQLNPSWRRQANPCGKPHGTDEQEKAQYGVAGSRRQAIASMIRAAENGIAHERISICVWHMAPAGMPWPVSRNNHRNPLRGKGGKREAAERRTTQQDQGQPRRRDDRLQKRFSFSLSFFAFPFHSPSYSSFHPSPASKPLPRRRRQRHIPSIATRQPRLPQAASITRPFHARRSLRCLDTTAAAARPDATPNTRHTRRVATRGMAKCIDLSFRTL